MPSPIFQVTRYGYGSKIKATGIGLQVFVHVETFVRDPFWGYPIFVPQPYVNVEFDGLAAMVAHTGNTGGFNHSVYMGSNHRKADLNECIIFRASLAICMENE